MSVSFAVGLRLTMASGQNKVSALTVSLQTRKKKNAFWETNVLRRNFLKSEQEQFSDFQRLKIPSADLLYTLESLGEEGKALPFKVLTELSKDSPS